VFLASKKKERIGTGGERRGGEPETRKTQWIINQKADLGSNEGGRSGRNDKQVRLGKKEGTDTPSEEKNSKLRSYLSEKRKVFNGSTSQGIAARNANGKPQAKEVDGGRATKKEREGRF